MPNFSTSSVTHHRKQIGSYNIKPDKITQKPINKTIRKAQNASESIRTHHSSSRTNTSSAVRVALKTMVILAVAASAMTPIGALENGARNNNGPAESTFCSIGLTIRRTNEHKGYCSGLKINNRQIVTAKHCANIQETSVWARNRQASQQWASHRKDHPDPNVDLTILSFPQDLAGNTYCLPLMTKETQDLLARSPTSICGLKARAIIEARGAGSTESNALFSYPFYFIPHEQGRGKYEANKLTLLKGVKHNNQSVCPQSGDSGAPIVACNPKTGDYEIMGFHVKSIWSGRPKTCDKIFSGFVDTAHYPELKEWLINNTEPCVSTDGYALKPNDFFKTNAHSWDKCRIPMAQDALAGISVNERCDCFYNNFQTPPEPLNCPSKNKGEAACVDISTFEDMSGNEANPSKIIIKNNCNEPVTIALYATTNDGCDTRRLENRIEKRKTKEIALRAEEALDKSKGIKFKHCGATNCVGVTGIEIPKFFETVALETTAPTTAAYASIVTEPSTALTTELSTFPATELSTTSIIEPSIASTIENISTPAIEPSITPTTANISTSAIELSIASTIDNTTFPAIKPNITSTAELNTTLLIEPNITSTAELNTTLAIDLSNISTSERINATSPTKSETEPKHLLAARKDDQVPPPKDNTHTKFTSAVAGFAALGLATAVAVTCRNKKQNKGQFNPVPTHPPV